MELALVIAVIAIALVFDYTNGFHDAANAIATSVSTRALTPRVALLLGAVMNFVGAFLGTEVAETVGKGIINAPSGTQGLTVVLGALIGAILWNLITWYYGLPSSSSQALIGGLVGAAVVAAGSSVDWNGVTTKVIIPMVLSPTVGFVGAYLLMLGIMWAFRRVNPGKANRGFRLAQTVSAAAVALGHGLQDAQKTMGVIFLALVVYGSLDSDDPIPWWVKVAAASSISLGTYAGGWRIMRTLGRRIIHLDPPRGFAAETTAATTLYVMALGLHAPVSTTQTITASVVGVGATKRLSAVRWGVARSIAIAWVLTIPAAAVMAALAYGVTEALVP